LQPARDAATDLGSFSFARTDQPNITVETVKKAEKSDAIVVRIFEHANIRADATITFGLPIKSVRTVNLMEEGESKPLELTGNGVRLQFRPFEIVTLLVET
jgi:alpha-mannosidase